MNRQLSNTQLGTFFASFGVGATIALFPHSILAQTPPNPELRPPTPNRETPTLPNRETPELRQGEESFFNTDAATECEIETATKPEKLLETIPPPTGERGAMTNPPNSLTLEFIGNRVYSDGQLQQLLEDQQIPTQPDSFPQVLAAASAITKYYNDTGYINSYAVPPPQTVTDGAIKIVVIEGGIETIRLIRENNRSRLRDNYICDRIAAATTPLNLTQLLDTLRQLQLNPLIKSISAELTPSARLESHHLNLRFQEAKTLTASTTLANSRPPSVGGFRRRGQLTQANLLGLGDSLTVGYSNTDGSNAFDINYTLPINPQNGTVTLAYGTASSGVIEDPFKALNLLGDSQYFDFTFRQPLHQTASEAVALSVTASRRNSQTSILGFNFPLSPGADAEGKTRLSALRFGVEWEQLSDVEVFALRGQVSVGLDIFNATINSDSPDSRFLSTQIQSLWLRSLAPDTLLLLQGNLQLADRPLLSQEQFTLGGLGNVRGYRQDAFLRDNGAFASVEVQYPLWGNSEANWGVLQVTPFLDFGTAWNHGETTEAQTLLSIGTGLRWSIGDHTSATIYWGIPLIDIAGREATWQDNGIHFVIQSQGGF
ncbi:ShlB/FhaC/HecB family hemolysin secretion/activation protein [Spirulina sp. CS-785/01]|uniref:ShlB/FhaC/HecB family hemolysin secretion/activation protein n=1 Tax=Spirulina sp. CS-785/01 TaxID=3021716 RepID=UPI00232F54B6|nr:ShlB/FhaC/HecB family hemolysin secretion/activation protein [Spirulina sp. CS-785/01]MDB9313632.1 ShlB/FhaC/HecB family hemolysin secretion/activation protein [Spirulina sp. CS-785/01]